MTSPYNTKQSSKDISATGEGSNINQLLEMIYHHKDNLKFGLTDNVIKFIICHSQFVASLIEFGVETEFYSTNLETKVLSPGEMESSRPRLKDLINSLTPKYKERYMKEAHKELDALLSNKQYYGEYLFHSLLKRKLPNKSISEEVPTVSSSSGSSSGSPALRPTYRQIQDPKLVERVKIFNQYWAGSFEPVELNDLDEPTSLITHAEEKKTREDWCKEWIDIEIPWYSNNELPPPHELLAEANKLLDKKTETYNKRVQTSNRAKNIIKKCYANHYDQGLLDLHEKRLTNCEYIAVEHDIFTHIHQSTETGFQNLYSAMMDLEQPAYCTVEESIALVDEIYELLYIAKCMVNDKDTYNPRKRLPEARRCAGGKLRPIEIAAAGLEVVEADANILAMDIRRYDSKQAPSWCGRALAKFNDMDNKDKTAKRLREIAIFQNSVKPYIPKPKVHDPPPRPYQDAAKRQKTGENTYQQQYASPESGVSKTSNPYYTPNKKHSPNENRPPTKSTPEMRNGLFINPVTDQPFSCQTHRKDDHSDGPTGNCNGWWANYNARATANNAHAENPPAGSTAVPTHITDEIFPHKELTAEVINQVYTTQHKNPQQLTVKPCSLCAALGDAQEQSQKDSHAAIYCGIFRGCNCADAKLKRQARIARRKEADNTRGGGRNPRGGRGGRDTSPRGRGGGQYQQQPFTAAANFSFDRDDMKNAYRKEIDLLEARWAYVPLATRQRYEASFSPERLNSKSFTEILMNKFKSPTSTNNDNQETQPQSSNVNNQQVEYEDPYDVPIPGLTPGRTNFATTNSSNTLPVIEEGQEVEDNNNSEKSHHHSDDGMDDAYDNLNANTAQAPMEVDPQHLSQWDRDNLEFGDFENSANQVQSSSSKMRSRDEDNNEILEMLETSEVMNQIDEDLKTEQSGDASAVANMAGSSST